MQFQFSLSASAIALITVFAVVPVVQAHATTITTAIQTITFGPGPTEFSGASQPLNLFDSTLGTLDSIIISGSFGFNSDLTVINSAAGPSSGSVRAESASSFTSTTPSINTIIQTLLDTVGSVTVGSTTLNPAAFDLLGSNRTYSLGSGGSVNLFSNASVSTHGPLTDTALGDLAAFEAHGGGLFNVLFNTATGTLMSNTGGNTSAGQVTMATGTVSISYAYDTIPTSPTGTPEPASLALMGTAVIGLGAILRRRRGN